MVTGFLAYSLSTGGKFLDLLKYNFENVAQDQWWYFGPYGDSFRIFSWADLPKILSAEVYFPLVMLVLVAIVSVLKRSLDLFLLGFIGLSLFSGGFVASVGGHISGYFGSFYFWGSFSFLNFVLLGAIKLFDFLNLNRFVENKIK